MVYGTHTVGLQLCLFANVCFCPSTCLLVSSCFLCVAKGYKVSTKVTRKPWTSPCRRLHGLPLALSLPFLAADSTLCLFLSHPPLLHSQRISSLTLLSFYSSIFLPIALLLLSSMSSFLSLSSPLHSCSCAISLVIPFLSHFPLSIPPHLAARKPSCWCLP